MVKRLRLTSYNIIFPLEKQWKSEAWWLTPVIPELWERRNGQKFKVTLPYIVSFEASLEYKKVYIE